MNTASTASVFRPDIEGLRAVAVLSVLIYHAGLPLTGGYVGVDVFFVISGFLITGLLLREVDRAGSISLLGFYARRAKRLLPAASLVLVTSIPLSWWLAPSTEHGVFALDVVGAAAYFVNWRFAERAVDYLAEDIGRSPVLHFWSLSVEEQFYFIWPLLIIVAVASARKLGQRVRPTTALALLLVLVPSFAWSIHFTEQSRSEAFFVTTTRLWELSVGALTALAEPLVARLPARLARVPIWLGTLMILVAAAYFDDAVAWPGYLAALPTLGTALVILGGSFAKGGWLLTALSSRPMVWVGRLSYSVYLWHWPFVVVGQDWLRLDGALWGLVLVTASFVPAWLSYRFVERPVRFAPALTKNPLKTLALGGSLSLFSVAAGLLFTTLASKSDAASQSEQSVVLSPWRGTVVAKPSELGAGALGREPTRAEAGKAKAAYDSMTPEPLVAAKDIPRAYPEGCQARPPDVEPTWCEIGDRGGDERVVVLGDSKILQYYEAIDAIGLARGWRVSTATKSSCPSTDAMKFLKGAPYEACHEFNERVMQQIERNPPKLVITSQVTSKGYAPGTEPVTTEEGMIAGLVSRWSKLRKLGVEVAVVLDNPHPNKQVYKCMAKNAKRARRCSFARKQGIEASAAATLTRAAAQVPGVHVVDLTEYICPQSRCAPVIGDVLVYRQGSHITNTYAKTLAPVFSRQLEGIADE